MKNIIFKFLGILILNTMNLYAQDIFNPYVDLTTKGIPYQHPPQYPPYPGIPYGAINPNGINWHSDNSSISGGYTGEYMISLKNHFWDFDPKFSGLAKTYSMEVVSFPFTVNCWDDATGCASPISPLDKRVLTMPDDQYNNVDKWGDLSRIKENGSFTSSPTAISGQSAGTIPEALVTTSFKANLSWGISTRTHLPHTIIKHTVYLHCDNTTTSDVISQFSFYYDNTRGRMRFYPFLNDNASTSYPAQAWDVVFKPELIVEPYLNQPSLSYYNLNGYTNSNWFDNGGTINYFPFLSASNSCNNSLFPPNDGANFYYGDINSYNGLPTDFIYYYPFPGPFTLYSTFLRNTYSNLPAGYFLDGSTNLLTYIQQGTTGVGVAEGIKHTYQIDQNINLLILNPSEQTIYNPSEVTLTASADDLVFPEHYTFKTIRGVYPTFTEVGADNIAGNGGPYTDEREVPVTTDLVSENSLDAANFPLSIQAATKHLYASRYYLDAGSKLTISNCVRLLDATFDVMQGSTMIFNDYTTTVGIEHHTVNAVATPNSRFKVQTLGGAVLRNYAPIQYLQNGIITQNIPLHYIATETILAGNNVATDSDVPDFDYSIEATGNVTLEAGNTVHLKEGFRAKAGSSFRAITAQQSIAIPCPPFAKNVVAARLANNKSNNQLQGVLDLQATPNPTQGAIILSYQGKAINAEKIVIRDVLGKIIFEKNQFNSLTDMINLNDEHNGIYMATIFDLGQMQTVKFVLQK